MREFLVSRFGIGFVICLFAGVIVSGCDLSDFLPEETIDDDLHPVKFVWAVHVEGHVAEATEEIAFNAHVIELEKMRSVLEDHGIKITWEIRTDEFLAAVNNFSSDIIEQWQAAGHGVEIHADLGGTIDNTTLLTSQLADRVEAMQDFGLSPVSVSGVCSAADWVSAVDDNDLKLVDGVVEYCLKSLSATMLPPEYAWVADCTNPADCHSSLYYEDTFKSITPWRPMDTDNWLTPSMASGLPIILPGGPWDGTVKCLDEGFGSGCVLRPEDAVAIEDAIDDILAARRPDGLHAFGLTESVGDTVRLPGLRAVADVLAAAIERGDFESVTAAELVDDFEAWEATH